jgi:hypothetical protein
MSFSRQARIAPAVTVASEDRYVGDVEHARRGLAFAVDLQHQPAAALAHDRGR